VVIAGISAGAILCDRHNCCVPQIGLDANSRVMRGRGLGGIGDMTLAMREEKKVHNEISCCNPGNLPAKRAHAKEQFDEGGIIREIPARLAAQDGIPATRRPRLSGVESMLGSGFGSSIHEYIYMENLSSFSCLRRVMCACVAKKKGLL